MAELGQDVGGYLDVDPQGAMVSGRTMLAQDLARRYSTPRGRLIDDPNYGYDLTDYIYADMSPADFAAMQAGAEQEAVKDERVESAVVLATLRASGDCEVEITVTDSDGDFKLVLSVSAVTVTLLTVSQ